MKKILIFTSDWGHLSIAKAIKESVSTNFDAELCYIGAERNTKILNDFVYRVFPKLFKSLFKLSGTCLFQKLAIIFAIKSYEKQLTCKMSVSKPEIVVNTYWAFNPSLEKLAVKFGYRFINVFADPWTFHEVLISKHAENLVFDNYSEKVALSFAPKATVYPVGWFVKNKYFEIQGITRTSVRKELGLDPGKFTLCLTSGSEGTFDVLKIIKAFLNPKYNLQIIMMCGNNKTMHKAALTLKSLSKKIGGPTIFPVPYSHEMQKYLRASDMTVGKAGPNTLFESVATLTPFFAISHFHGQEDGNLDIIRHYKIGFVEENPYLATKELEKIIKNPKVLNKFQNNLKILSDYCQCSGKRLTVLLKS